MKAKPLVWVRKTYVGGEYHATDTMEGSVSVFGYESEWCLTINGMYESRGSLQRLQSRAEDRHYAKFHDLLLKYNSIRSTLLKWGDTEDQQ